MDFHETIERLTAALARPLPGLEAQARMAVRPRRFWQPGKIPEGCKAAAGLLLVYPFAGEASVLLTVRSARVSSHRGQVSLPGGGVDAGESLEQAALREAAEEVGLDPAGVGVLGLLTPLHIPVSGYVLHPVVATSPRRPGFRPSEHEVERLLEVPIATLASPDRLVVETWEREGHAYEVPFFRVEGETVWGATAMVLAELLELLGVRPDPWGDAV